MRIGHVVVGKDHVRVRQRWRARLRGVRHGIGRAMLEVAISGGVHDVSGHSRGVPVASDLQEDLVEYTGVALIIFWRVALAQHTTLVTDTKETSRRWCCMAQSWFVWVRGLEESVQRRQCEFADAVGRRKLGQDLLRVCLGRLVESNMYVQGLTGGSERRKLDDEIGKAMQHGATRPGQESRSSQERAPGLRASTKGAASKARAVHSGYGMKQSMMMVENKMALCLLRPWNLAHSLGLTQR